MMASGKSTVGRLLAHELGAHFVDLDVRVERMAGRSIPELIADSPIAFRRAESRALQSLLAEPGFSGRAVIVATGGGVVIDEANRRLMRETGAVVHLDVDVDALAQRLAEDPGARPLLPAPDGGEGPGADWVAAVRARLGELLATRRGAYKDCDARVDGRGDPQDVVARVVSALASLVPLEGSQAV